VNPAEEYTERLQTRRTTYTHLLTLHDRFSYARLALFAAATIVAWLAFGRHAISGWWLAPLVLVFAGLMKEHDRVIRRRDAAARAVGFYERGLARIEDRWMGGGEAGDRFRDDDHPYANDLDLFGSGSLFELLSIARTRAGEETLARWLKSPAAPDAVRARQQAVEEMTPSLDLRESLALAGTDMRSGVNSALLVEWAAAPAVLGRQWPWTLASVLTIGAIAAAVYGILIRRPEPIALVAVLEVLLSIRWRRRVQHVLHAADQAARDLDVLAHVLAQLERERFESRRLSELRAALGEDGVTASRAIRQLHYLAEMHDWQHNQFFAPLAAFLLWGTHLAHAIERWRTRHGSKVSGWLAVVGEFEAFSSLSAYRYEHPEDAFPHIVDDGPAAYDGDALGHPLLPAARMVRNDVHLSGGICLLVVSGSNMSGKSTLLRTVGINAVLAFAGAPVRASQLHLTPLAIGATLRIQDSLQEGRSRFYAEITRIRRLADLANGPLPLLFLLDELFHGTNSHDRLVGATGVLRSFVERGAIGLITTHDLALTSIADDLAPQAVNVHFEDTFEGGEIRFDYRMKPGPVTRSNAIALMRSVGLDVDPQLPIPNSQLPK
jgi:hypothetical protein